MELSLIEIFRLLIKRFWFIALSIILCAGILYIKNNYFTSPTYTASVQMYVSSSDNTKAGDLNELTYAQKIVTTYIGFLQTKNFFKSVIEESGLSYGPDQLKAMTTIQTVNNTEIFQISVTSLSAMDSYKLVTAMEKIAPDHIKNIKGKTTITVVDPPVIPVGPSGPNIRFNTMVGAFLGFAIAVIACFLRELFDVKVKNSEDLLKRYNIPIIGTIPNYGNKNQSHSIFIKIIKTIYLRLPFKGGKGRYQKDINIENKFFVLEAYNALRTNLRFCIRKEGCKKLIISSPTPEDGKSSTSMNLAITISQTGAKVLLLDCDLRRGILHNKFKIKSAPGISDILSGLYEEKNIIQYTSYDKLDVLTMGVIPPNPTELLGSLQMEELIKRLEKMYDYILIDTPPVNVVSDTLSMIKMVDGIVIVVREGITTHPNIAAAISKFNFTRANIVGFVINGATIRQNYKSNSHYYSRNKINEN